MTQFTTIPVGNKAPNFTLPNGLGQQMALTDSFGTRGVVLAFIHNTWCPECMRGVIGFRRTYWLMRRLGIQLLIVAHQTETSLAAYLLSQSPSLPFPILADVNGAIFTQYQLDQASDLHQIKATFFIDPTGIIRKANVGSTYGLLTPFGI